MKHSNLLAFSAALVIALTCGCRTNQPKTTPLPGAHGVGDNSSGTDVPRATPNINTPPSTAGNNPIGSGVSGAPVGGDNLPDDAKLDGREQNRSRFAGDTIYFDFDRANVKPSDASKVSRVASEFKSLPPGHDLLVEGHCDERGTEGYNQALGERRALAARELLMKEGIDGQHVFTKSFGKDRPADTGHNEAAWGKNRRGEFILVLPRKITTTQNPQ